MRFAPFQSGKGAIAFIRKRPAYHAQGSHFGLHKSDQAPTTYLWTSKRVWLDECLGDLPLVQMCDESFPIRAGTPICPDEFVRVPRGRLRGKTIR